jgi:hypothetical protein
MAANTKQYASDTTGNMFQSSSGTMKATALSLLLSIESFASAQQVYLAAN